MLKQKFLLTLAVLASGTTLAFADSAPNATQPTAEKLERLESKIEALESRIDQYLPKSGFEVEVGTVPYQNETVKKMVSWSSKDHLKEANAHQQKAVTLEKKIQDLNDRINRLTEKPYLDTKGFKRASLKRIKGNLMQDFRDATTKTVWHKTQAAKTMMSESTQSGSGQNS